MSSMVLTFLSGRRCGPGGGAMRGFTMIELLVTMTILGLLAMVAVPSFNEAILGNKLTSYANSFVSSAQLARSEAIKRNATVRVCRSADGASCTGSGTWQVGWIVFHDINNDGIVDSGETVIHVQQALSSDYHFTEENNIYSVTFQAIGVGATAATLTLCRATPSAGSQEREIKISLMGRTSVEPKRTGICT